MLPNASNHQPFLFACLLQLMLNDSDLQKAAEDMLNDKQDEV